MKNNAVLLCSSIIVGTLFGLEAADAARIELTAPTTFYVSTTGNDSTGDGTSGNPWATRGKAYSVLQAQYDLGTCHQVTIQLADGTYTDSFQAYGGIVGQCSPNQIIVNGNATTPNNVLIQPATSTGYASSAAFGAQYNIQNMVMDMSNNINQISGADTVSVGQGGRIAFGPGVTFGCNFNGFNGLSVSFGGYVQFDTDFTIDVGRCQASKSGSSYANNSNVISINGGTTDIAVGMGVVSTVAGVPTDAYVGSTTTNQVTLTCIYTSPCQTSAAASNVNVLFVGGGQTFIDMGNGAQGYFNTNGQPDYSVIVTLANYPFYLKGFFYINGVSAINAQAITFVNASQARGLCSVTTGLSATDTGLQGVPYIPCDANGVHSPIVGGVSLTSGSKTFTVSSATGIKVGNSVNGISIATGSFSAGSSTVTVSTTVGMCSGAHIIGDGILSGAVVQSVGSGSITLNPCGPGPRCVSSYPTYLAKSNVQLFVTGCGQPNGSVVTDISGNQITVSEPAISTTTQSLIFQGEVIRGSIYY